MSTCEHMSLNDKHVTRCTNVVNVPAVVDHLFLPLELDGRLLGILVDDAAGETKSRRGQLGRRYVDEGVLLREERAASW